MKSMQKIDSSSLPPSTILAGDIGGTKSHLALFSHNREEFTIIRENRYTTKDFNNAGKMIKKFLSDDNIPHSICLGVAGPVQNGKVNLTNVSWQLDSLVISNEFDHTPVYIINDLEATAYGLNQLKGSDIHQIYEPSQKYDGNIALIAPGTGLGEAGIYYDGKQYHPFATEGGHCDFAPQNELDIDLYRHLHKKYDHVSWERLISGPGIVDIFEFLSSNGREIPLWLTDKLTSHDRAAVISSNAGDAAICMETMELFFKFLAREAANLALKLKATGGLYIGGGILPKIIKLLPNETFIRWFRGNGRMKSLLQQISLKVILNDKTALLGAAFYGSTRSPVLSRTRIGTL